MSILLAVVVVVVVVLVRSTRRREAAVDVSGAAVRDEGSGAETATRTRADSLRTSNTDYPTYTNAQKSSGNVAMRQILKEVRARIALRAGLRQPIEAQVNNITDYLRGILVGIRATDPSVIGALRAEYEGALCGSNSPSDVEVLVFTKLAVMQPEVASPRALNCAIERRQTEDIVMWSLLDAWSATGQAPLAAVSSLEGRFSDPRTLQRLRTPEELRAELKATRAEFNATKRSGGGLDDRAPPGASRPVRQPLSQRAGAE
jgi:hypothetical protein